MKILRLYICALLAALMCGGMSVSSFAQEAVLQVPKAEELLATPPAQNEKDSLLDESLGNTPIGDLLAPPSSQNKETIKAYAQKLYERCKATPSPNLKPEDHEEYCTCLSAQMYRPSLTNEERIFMAEGQGGQMDPKRVTSEFYGACLGAPGRAATYHQCIMTRDIFKYVKDDTARENLCQCVVARMGQYWDVEAPAYIEMTMRRRPQKLEGDIIEALMRGRDYLPMYMNERTHCIRIYGRRD